MFKILWEYSIKYAKTHQKSADQIGITSHQAQKHTLSISIKKEELIMKNPFSSAAIWKCMACSATLLGQNILITNRQIQISLMWLSIVFETNMLNIDVMFSIVFYICASTSVILSIDSWLLFVSFFKYFWTWYVVCDVRIYENKIVIKNITMELKFWAWIRHSIKPEIQCSNTWKSCKCMKLHNYRHHRHHRHRHCGRHQIYDWVLWMCQIDIKK